jgi:ribosomal protein S18 acetylase RimI-like enzyme
MSDRGFLTRADIVAPCKILDWDSEFFGVRIGQIEGNLLTDTTIDSVLQWSHDQQVDCLYFLCAPDDDTSVRVAEQHQFHLVDIRIELSWPVRKIENRSEVDARLFRPDDLATLQQIAAETYQLSRFYFDQGFPKDLASGLYREWITKSCNGYAEAVFVADYQGSVGGFITCHLDDVSRRGRIGLLGVAETARGSGIGCVLIEAAQRYFSDREMRDVFVVTQARNIAAQRLYQSCGFRTQSVGLWYHRWFSADNND